MPPGDSPVRLNRSQLLSVIFNAQQSSPCLLCLVCLSVSFSCSRLIQIKLSFMFLSRSPSPPTENYRHMCKAKSKHTRHVHTRHGVVLQLSTSTEATLSFVKGLESQLLPSLCMCVFVCTCRTYSEVSERRPLKASAAMSEIWFLLKSLGTRERGELGTFMG